jgi:hypothetical protein
MTVLYRPVVEAELPETVEIFTTSVVDMYARSGIKAPPPERGVILMHYTHVFRTGIFYVAEVDGALAAICHAVVRDELWFLSGFWALPLHQHRRIGSELLKLVREEGARVGTRIFFTWSSVDLAAMASYMKMDMLPGYQILTFAGRPLDHTTPQAPKVEVEPLSLTVATAIDKRIRGTAREADHRFWQEEARFQGRQLVVDGIAQGYFYLNGGTIGPAAWVIEDAAPALLATATREAAANSAEVRLMIPGANHTAIRFALGSGLRLTAFSHLLTSAPFGRMEQYLSSGPSLF